MKSCQNCLIAAFVVVAASGCASDVVVRMPPPVPEAGAGAALASVTVLDTRAPGVAASKRESLGQPMGVVTFDPPEAQLLKAHLEAELSRLMAAKGITRPENFSVALTEFGVNTQSTPVYWDCIARIALVLKHGTREFPLTGSGTQRTYAWPGEEVLRKAVSDALAQLNAGLPPVVDAL